MTRLQQTGGSGPAPASYGYDPVGNRVSVTANGGTTYAAYDSNNRLCWDGGATTGTCGTPTAGATTYVNDNNGNRTSRTVGGVTTTYGYDAANRLVSVGTGGGTPTTYQYDGDGYRVAKTTGGTTTAFTWDRLGAGGLGAVIGDGAGEYIFGPAGLQARVAGGAAQWSHADGLGSVQLVTSGAGAVAGGGGYEPWGAAQPGTTGLGAFAFAGEQGDGESGLVALRARHYDPATGRFLQQDPAGMAASGPNLYAYAGGNPTNYTDPSGTFAMALLAAPAAAAVGTVSLPAILVGAVAAVAVFGIVVGVGYAVSQLSGPQAYSGDTGGMLGSPYYAGDTGALLGSPSGGAVAPLLTTIGPAPFLGYSATHPGGRSAYDGDRVTLLAALNLGSYKSLSDGGAKDAHHIFQDAAMRNLPGYTRGAAPAIELPGPSTLVGSPHYRATRVQDQAGGGTYAAERRIGYKALRAAGVSKADARTAIAYADSYFQSIGVGPSTKTRMPGNR